MYVCYGYMLETDIDVYYLARVVAITESEFLQRVEALHQVRLHILYIHMYVCMVSYIIYET